LQQRNSSNTHNMRGSAFSLILISLVLLFCALAWAKSEKKQQEPHYKNGEHNKKYHKHNDDKHRVDDDDDDEPKHKAEKSKPTKEKGCPHMENKKHCPEFQEGDCPFKDKDSQKVDAAGCPKFQEGCPYTKDTDSMEKLQGCPEFKEGCPYHEGDAAHGHEGCPAFDDGCPYHHSYDEALHSPQGAKDHKCPVKHSINCPYVVKGTGEVKQELSECPKFKDGCPYTESQEELEKIKGCPAFKEDCPFEKGENVDISKWNNCPAFVEGCPYDIVHYEGHKLKEKATHFVTALLNGGNIDEFVADNFTADMIGISSSSNTNTAIDRSTFEKAFANLRSQDWQITTTDRVADGHTVVLNSRLNGNLQAKQIENLALVTIHHFTKDGKVEKLQVFLDGLNYARQVGN